MTKHMQEQATFANGGLEQLVKNLKSTDNRDEKTKASGAPVHLWNPDYCGELDLTIEEDGSWAYNKTPIGRLKLVKLFASVVKKEEGKYYLVTPVEKMAIKVKDVPFIAIEMNISNQKQQQIISFTTNVGDQVEASAENPLRFPKQSNEETLKPYVKIRHEGENMLEAKLSRSVYYELANHIDTHTIEGTEFLGVWSHGTFFTIEKSANCLK
ncbi:DUF1285 domain-containing protein [Hyphomicrobiales bacterium 4NK60-0047b]